MALVTHRIAQKGVDMLNVVIGPFNRSGKQTFTIHDLHVRTDAVSLAFRWCNMTDGSCSLWLWWQKISVFNLYQLYRNEHSGVSISSSLDM